MISNVRASWWGLVSERYGSTRVDRAASYVRDSLSQKSAWGVAAVVNHRVVISTNLDDYDKAPTEQAGYEAVH